MARRASAVGTISDNSDCLFSARRSLKPGPPIRPVSDISDNSDTFFFRPIRADFGQFRQFGPCFSAQPAHSAGTSSSSAHRAQLRSISAWIMAQGLAGLQGGRVAGLT